MKKYDCNNTLDYSHEFRRMCKTFRSSRGQKICKGCPLTDLPCDILSITSEHIKRMQTARYTHSPILLGKLVECGNPRTATTLKSDVWARG